MTIPYRMRPKHTVRCPFCGNTREVSDAHARRIRRDPTPTGCTNCQRLGDRQPTEDAYWFWLEKYGVARNGITALQYVERYGMPEGLLDLIHDVRPTPL